MYCSSSKSPASAASLPVLGAVAWNKYSPRAPSREQYQGNSNSLIAASTPSHQRFPSGTILANASSVKTFVSVARIAAKLIEFPAKVLPIPPVSIISRDVLSAICAAISRVIPNVPVGIPPAIALPIVKISGFNPCNAVIPPGPTEIVCVSSMIQTAPYFLARSPTAFKYPSSGSTIPIFVIAGSIRIAATSPLASAASIPAKSLNSTTRVVSSSGTGAPRFPSRFTVLPALSSVAKVSSTLP